MYKHFERLSDIVLIFIYAIKQRQITHSVMASKENWIDFLLITFSTISVSVWLLRISRVSLCVLLCATVCIRLHMFIFVCRCVLMYVSLQACVLLSCRYLVSVCVWPWAWFCVWVITMLFCVTVWGCGCPLFSPSALHVISEISVKLLLYISLSAAADFSYCFFFSLRRYTRLCFRRCFKKRRYYKSINH